MISNARPRCAVTGTADARIVDRRSPPCTSRAHPATSQREDRRQRQAGSRNHPRADEPQQGRKKTRPARRPIQPVGILPQKMRLKPFERQVEFTSGIRRSDMPNAAARRCRQRRQPPPAAALDDDSPSASARDAAHDSTALHQSGANEQPDRDGAPVRESGRSCHRCALRLASASRCARRSLRRPPSDQRIRARTRSSAPPHADENHQKCDGPYTDPARVCAQARHPIQNATRSATCNRRLRRCGSTGLKPYAKPARPGPARSG